jgi:hypothetical protein
MNKTIKLAVAGAVLSAASMANAGIIIPAGEWTIDINGNVNAYATYADYDRGTGTVINGIAGGVDGNGEDTSYGLNTGLLPAWLGFTGTTRQNDLDVSWTISFQPNVSDNTALGMGDQSTPLNRQAFMTFGDKSWGSIKLGKDLGIFAGDAILNDMTLLGVGAGGGGSGGATSLGGIGTGYIYPAWRGQFAYTTPNMNGFQATIAITNPDQGQAEASTVSKNYSDRFGVEAKASYAFNAGSSTGKLWVSGASYSRESATGTTGYKTTDWDAQVADIGVAVTNGNLGLTGYYYSGSGVGTGLVASNLLGANGAYCTGSASATVSQSCEERDSDGGYIQATYVIPTGTKLGMAYGVSRLDLASNEAAGSAQLDENSRWTVGAYHPLTKHLNLVAEYNAIESDGHNA